MAGNFLEYVTPDHTGGDRLECVYVADGEHSIFSLHTLYTVDKKQGSYGVWGDNGSFTTGSWSKFVVRDPLSQKEYPNFYKEKDCLVYYKTIRDHLDYVNMTKKIFVLIGGDNFTPESDEVFEEIMERLSNDPSIKQNVDIE